MRLRINVFYVESDDMKKYKETECDKDMLSGRFSELPQNLTKKLKPNAIERDINYCISMITNNSLY